MTSTSTSLRRIRVKTVAHLPLLLPETRAWLQYDIHRHPTVAHCRDAFLEQLGLHLDHDHDDGDLRMTLDGFDLLETLSSETLDPVGSCCALYIKTRTSSLVVYALTHPDCSFLLLPLLSLAEPRCHRVSQGKGFFTITQNVKLT